MTKREIKLLILTGFLMGTPQPAAAEELERKEAPPAASRTAEPAAGSQNSGAADSGKNRAELWRALRLEKLNRLEPHKITTVESLMLWLEKQARGLQARPRFDDAEAGTGMENSSMNDLLGIDYQDRYFPQFGSIRPGSGVGIGFRFWEPRVLGSKFGIEAFANATSNRYQQYRVKFGKLVPLDFIPELSSPILEKRRDHTFFYGDVRYDYFPEEDFFGLGGESPEGTRSDFLLEKATYSFVSGLKLKSHLTTAVRVGVSQVELGAGGDSRFVNTDLLFDEVTAPGLTQRTTDFFELGTTVQLDYRDTSANPHQGAFLSFSFERFDDLRNSRFEFNRFSFDGRGYIPLGSRQRVLAIQFLTSFSDADGGSRIPFYLQRTLGGTDTLRGFEVRRFRGENLLHLSGEYRWEASENIELAGFYDTGKVFQDKDEFKFDRLEKSFGFGIRFKTTDAAFLRFDVARSDERTRVIITFAHPF